MRSGTLRNRNLRKLSLLLVLSILGLGNLGCGGGAKEDGAAAADSTAVAAGKSDEAAPAEGSDEASGDEAEETESRQPRERATTVNAARVTRGDLVVPVIAEGAIRARRLTEVRSEIGGRIERLAVEEGQQVRKGQTLAVLDGREYRIAIEEARSRLLKALGVIAVEEDSVISSPDSEGVEKKIAQLQKLEKEGKITFEERRSREIELGVQALREGAYRRELVEARSGLSQARADEERAKLNLERTIIKAPFSGTVSKMTLVEGQLLSLGEAVCTLVDNVDLEAEVGVLESDVGGLVVGRPALLEVPALEETLRVNVDVINPTIDADSRTCRVLLRVKNDSGKLQPGMFVRASIAGKIYHDRLLVPNEAILTRDGRPLLFKVEDDRAKWVYVRLGLRNDRLVEIERVLQGGPLDEGTLVVVSDHLTLSHDAKVKVRRVVDMTVAWETNAEE